MSVCVPMTAITGAAQICRGTAQLAAAGAVSMRIMSALHFRPSSDIVQ